MLSQVQSIPHIQVNFMIISSELSWCVWLNILRLLNQCMTPETWFSTSAWSTWGFFFSLSLSPQSNPSLPQGGNYHHCLWSIDMKADFIFFQSLTASGFFFLRAQYISETLRVLALVRNDFRWGPDSLSGVVIDILSDSTPIKQGETESEQEGGMKRKWMRGLKLNHKHERKKGM